MKTVHLEQNPPSLHQLLDMAAGEAIMLVAEGGKTFILEETDDFDREVEALGQSERFMSFLEGRAREKGTIPIEQLANELRKKQA